MDEKDRKKDTFHCQFASGAVESYSIAFLKASYGNPLRFNK